LAAALHDALPDEVAAQLDDEEWIDLRDHFVEGGDMTSLTEQVVNERERLQHHTDRFLTARRTAYRLIGDPGAADAVAHAAVGALSDAPIADTSHPEVALRDCIIYVTELALAHRQAVDAAAPHSTELVDDRYRAHRIRLARDLLRHRAPERSFLAMRHLGLISATRIATMFSVLEDEVREVTSRWLPTEATASRSMLDSLDRWTNTTRHGGAMLDDPFTHLDDPDPHPFTDLEDRHHSQLDAAGTAPQLTP